MAERLEQKLAALVHDMMNQLQVLDGRVQLAALVVPTEEDPPVERAIPEEGCVILAVHLARARKASSMIAMMGRDALAIATQLIAPKRRRVDLNAEIREAALDLQDVLPGIEIVVQQNPRPLWTTLDREGLTRALDNMARNARDAMPAGGRLTLSAVIQNEGRMVCIQVSDTGSGMDARTLAHCFDPGFTTKGAKGTGIGLAQVKEFADDHGGTVRVDTAPGRGTTFELCVPRVLEAD